MQGEPIQFLAESHCAVRSSENSSLSNEQGGASGIAGKSRVAEAAVAFQPSKLVFIRTQWHVLAGAIILSVRVSGVNDSFYDELAESYHLIFDDWDAAILRQRDVLARLLPVPANGKRVLDCACGIGTQVIGLAMLGFSVEGSDPSDASIKRARREATARGMKAEFRVDDMRILSTAPIDSYDAIIAMDNAATDPDRRHDCRRPRRQWPGARLTFTAGRLNPTRCRSKVLTEDEARRAAVNIARLPESPCVRRGPYRAGAALPAGSSRTGCRCCPNSPPQAPHPCVFPLPWHLG
jgi:hypothetical protein